ncbi:aromatic ring-hydroxylating dioxygenase subunit alpha [Sulfitobacter aestuarii]|uniref:Aromatic ring-hydroxylating dioxygenase subunit alpha n=1 Tax=Sulfitobacter aestuarii TaxID=2161676 RepID=A0ABW5U128_9RHOB
MSDPACSDPVVRDLWHVIVACEEIPQTGIGRTRLLGEHLAYARGADGSVAVWRCEKGQVPVIPEDPALLLPVQERYAYVWTCLGTPAREIFDIPEFDEAERRNIHAASFGVHVSAPRAIENFLDMGHFPFVHTDILGAEPHTEVKEYSVEVSAERDEIIATNCTFWQPMAATNSTGGADVDYIYRVPHPFCAVLYKSSGDMSGRLDAIALFVQPLDQEHIRAHMLLTLFDEVSEDLAIRLFQQTIFAQDKPILENQYPKRLPLDPRAETPIRADKAAIAYRRWLSGKGLTYGVIPAAA